VLVYRVFDEECDKCADLLLQPHVESSKLVALLASLDVVKYSIGTERDLQSQVGVRGATDVQVVAHSSFGYPLKTTDTETLVHDFLPELRHSYHKNKALQISDWSRWPLSHEQEQYAASDALVALRVGLAMRERLSGSSVARGASSAASPAAAASSSAPVRLSLDLSYYERALNDIQKQCVESIVRNASFPHPYICFGPPGTGTRVRTRQLRHERRGGLGWMCAGSIARRLLARAHCHDCLLCPSVSQAKPPRLWRRSCSC
jgi:hypothetical protein